MIDSGAGAATTPAPADRIRADVEESILSGRLSPGARINADELARASGVSHIPVREALRSLEAEGWVSRRHNRGTYVRERDPAELADLFEARLVVERRAAWLAAQRRTAAQLDALARIVDRQEVTADDAALSAINCDFHVGLAGCAHNRVLEAMVADVNKRVRFYYLPTAGRRHDVSVAEHRAILDAVRDRDADRAADLLESHIADTRAGASAHAHREARHDAAPV
ncbi:FCD domain-containing protein [Gordonia jinghuaiqii]|uniref:GntR family transcriptional regulator n=1 Tax=Gordonia jinghuaiqii TaxID=2758710 RepID=A0A7D7LVZ6_9ACTN|nr:GntR family transcriptional regulator [Gordonia jinghuaiqii]MCR5978277.1 FCD domain-containing protein [Gordonia jinghuaiqii]QMT01279.1 GntR family transcriptional regulator [Gordonia jinghuaiqii]